MTSHPHLAQRLFNRPLAIREDKAELVMAALADRFGVTRLFRADGTAVILANDDWTEGVEPGNYRGYDVISGVARIPVEGTLVAKLGSLRPYSGMTGYDGIRAAFLMALSDPAVEAIVLDIDSPGGEVAGLFDLVDLIYQARGRKPIWAILSDCAYSAAYALASACDRIFVPRLGGVGSIGVIYMLTDISRGLDKEGVTVNIIRHGAHKAEGNPFEALSDDARQRLQAEIDVAGELFIATVARNRGLKPAAIANLNAECFTGLPGARPGAVETGLADAIAAPDEAFRALLDHLDAA